jgi:fermentation-respiration switch protein FrsA (DUF1100 family)
LKRTAGAAYAALIFALVVLLSGCSSRDPFFVPVGEVSTTPADRGFFYEEIELVAADGTKLCGWDIHLGTPHKGTLLHLHGNALTLSTHLKQVEWLVNAGYRVVMMEYRGFGCAEGEAVVADVVEDAKAWLSWTLANTPGPHFLYGQSLGGVIGLYAAATHPDRSALSGVISQSAFSDYGQMAKESVAKSLLLWPLQWHARDDVDNRFAPAHHVDKIAPVPLLIIHGDQDRITAVHHAHKIYEQAKEPKTLWIEPGIGHVRTLTNPQNRLRLLRWLETHGHSDRSD